MADVKPAHPLPMMITFCTEFSPPIPPSPVSIRSTLDERTMRHDSSGERSIVTPRAHSTTMGARVSKDQPLVRLFARNVDSVMTTIDTHSPRYSTSLRICGRHQPRCKENHFHIPNRSHVGEAWIVR